VKVSVIMPVERVGGDAERAVASVLRQETPFPFELIVVSAAPLEDLVRAGVRNVIEPNRNPATRRNRAVSESTGEILAFIDDDAVADPHWLANAIAYLDDHREVVALGGPDPAPDDSSIAELMSDTLLATRWIGSGVAAHENRRGIFAVRHASDIALVNLFVRRDAFTGFDESIGYIGEDTALVDGLLPHVVYSDAVRVFHRRRAFPGPYLRQRWRYRVKTGQLMRTRGSRPPKVQAFLIAGVIGLITLPLSLPLYLIATLILGARYTRLPARYVPLIPLAFAAHHATYFAGICWGVMRGSTLRRLA
jgi:glycosyltransferase involved in cell wall biosynthesis